MLENLIGYNLAHLVRVILDIGLLSLLFYFSYRLFSAVRIPLLFNQIALLVLTYIVASLLRLEVVLWIFNNVLGWLIIGLMVVFQPELRALVMRADYAHLFRKEKTKSIIPDFEKIKKVILYLQNLKRGALFVFPRRIELEYIISSKITLNADLSVELLQSIFSHDNTLHDGAVVIVENKITHAACFLPTDRGDNIMYELGSRHRAALGLSKNSDAIILVLSEEFGSTSLVYDGELLFDIGINKACTYAEQLLHENRIDIDFLQIENSEDSKILKTSKALTDV